MINVKVSGIAAGAAFIFSLLIGLLSGVGAATLFLRAFIFAAVFFGLACLIWWLLNQFMPELLDGGLGGLNGGLNGDENGADYPQAGSNVDITLGDEAETIESRGVFPADNGEVIDDINNPFSQVEKNPPSPLEQNDNSVYNGQGKSNGEIGEEPLPEKQEPFSASAEHADSGEHPASGSTEPAAAQEHAETDSLPDINEIDGGGEDSPDDDAEADKTDEEVVVFNTPEPRRSSSLQQAPQMGFPPNEVAQGLRTLLKKDEKDNR